MKRLRWVMLVAMFIDLVLTLISQPATYWRHPETADFGYHTFHFFLNQGWLFYLIVNLFYFAGAFLLISLLPKKMALVGTFTIILGHYLGASAWLDYIWHLNMAGPFLCSVLLGFAIFSALKNDPNSILMTGQIVKRLRWVMIAAMLIDMLNTIFGQPASYWHQSGNVNESFALSHFFLMRGMPIFLFYDVISFAALFFLVSILPKKAGLLTVWSLILAYYFGASTWLFSQWHFGPLGPLIYGSLLSTVFVLLTFTSAKSSEPRIGLFCRLCR
ncbi:MAG TPA: hypothetical protein VN873_03735 [Candidatus Angelobacter sp.]|nr:hypothetical protein [Candidatus Angelobacter sp.]